MWRHRVCLTFLALFLACCGRRPLPRGASWDAKSGRFTWWSGEVTLPRGFTYQVDNGADTFQGHFTSPDGKQVVRHDIGGYAGAWAAQNKSFYFAETVVEGSRVWIAKRDWQDGRVDHTTLIAVTFPDSGCANLYLASSRSESAAIIEFIARSFRPKGPTTGSTTCR